jgi:predicted ArsR family transcriptional regulator
MSTRVFDQQLGDLAASLGDTTRRGVFLTVSTADAPVTATEIASSFHIHPNVARHHLDRLVADGYLVVVTDPGPGRRAGRPAKRYRASDKEISVQFPARRYDLLAELLVRVVERVDPSGAAAVAEEIGFEFGLHLAGEIGLPDEAGFDDAARAVARAMMGVGFDTEADASERRLITSFCPFGNVASEHPEVVCRLDQGITRGLLAAASVDGAAVVTPRATPDEDCITEM